MAVVVDSTESGFTAHSEGKKWVVDDNLNLVVLDSSQKAVAIYAHGRWNSAEVTA